MALIVCYDIIIHGGVFLLLLAPISQHYSFEHRVEHIAFVPVPPSVVTQPLGNLTLFVSLGPPSLLGTREREDLYRSLTPFSPLQEP